METVNSPRTVSGSHIRQFNTLLRANLRVLRARLISAFTQSKLMTATIITFLLGYVIVGYVLFSFGLRYISNLSVLGPILSTRIFYLLFFFFFLMLAFSNAVINYTTLYRSKETRWLMTLPVGEPALYAWKFVETFLFSSWGLLVISAPLLAAYGGIRNAPPSFYFNAVLVAIPFAAIPAALASWVLVILVRYVNRWFMGLIAIIFAALLVKLAIGFFAPPETGPDTGGNIVATVNQVLQHTELSVHPLMPSTWISNAMAGWSRSESRALFYALLVLAYSLIGVWSAFTFGWRLFYPGYDASMRRSARAAWRRKQRRMESGERSLDRITSGGFLKPLRLLGVRRATCSLVRKDIITFWRDPAQWIQFVIVFGLLFLYVLNLRNMGYDYRDAFWSEVIIHLNLGVCSLALSTLTTRFIFPQFSLEGRRLWILCMSPINLGKVVIQKFLTSWLATGSVIVCLMAISGVMLEMPLQKILFYALMIALMSIALNALAVGLGTLFPNLRETNPAKIVSGFGGTLCLILSFLYIVVVIMALAYPAAVRLGKTGLLAEQSEATAAVVAMSVILVVTGVTAIIPLVLAVKRVKKVEILGNL